MSEQPPSMQIQSFCHKGEVIMVLSRQVQYLSFSAKQARETAASLIKLADELDTEKPTTQ